MDKLFLTGRHVTLSLYDEKYNNFLFECYNDIESRKLYTNDSSLLSIWNF